MTHAERRGELTPLVEAEFLKFVERIGGMEKAARALYADNHRLRERIREATSKPKQKPTQRNTRSPYRDDWP
jgi:hypothetical protein